MKNTITFLFAVLFMVAFFAKANDSLKVKKVRFFIEPKASFNIPMQTHISYINVVSSDLWNFGTSPHTYPGNYVDHHSFHNKISVNFGVSSGLSVKLCKHFMYEFSVSYNRLTYNITEQQSAYDFSGNYMWTHSDKYNTSYNILVFGHGIAYTNKRFIFSNNIKYGVFCQGSFITFLQDYNKKTDLSPLILISEHKIGYSFLKERIETYFGVNIIYNSTFGNVFKESSNYYNTTQTHNSFIPFTSVRINF